MIAARNERYLQYHSDSRDEIWRAIVSTLSGFSTHQRRVFVLYHYAGSSIASIAEKTGLSEERVIEIVEQTDHILMSRLRDFRVEHGQSLTGSIRHVKLAAC
jgi:DNA-directed RNA polymerase specialized sigma24 family protein